MIIVSFLISRINDSSPPSEVLSPERCERNLVDRGEPGGTSDCQFSASVYQLSASVGKTGRRCDFNMASETAILEEVFRQGRNR